MIAALLGALLAGAGFGAGGAVTTDFGGRVDIARAVVVQSDGKLLVAGVSTAAKSERSSFALSRYLDDGSLDSQFGDRGRVTTDLRAADGGAEDVLLLPDGRIVAVGSAWAVRYMPDGSLDRSFGGGDGVVHLRQVERRGDDCLRARAARLQADGKLVLAGSVGCGGEAGRMAGAVVRLDPGGQLDRSFAGDGTRTFAFGRCAFATDLAIQPDGKIIVAGGDGGCYEERGPFRIVRLGADGRLDRGFGRRGRQKVAFPEPWAWVEAIVPDGRGGVVLGGSAGGRTHAGTDRFAFALAHLEPDGTVDRGFGRGGTRGDAGAVARLPDGRIVVAGTLSRTSRRPQARVAVFRSNGAADTAFGRRGVRSVRYGGRESTAHAVTVDRTGRIVVVGSSRGGGTLDFAVARFGAR